MGIDWGWCRLRRISRLARGCSLRRKAVADSSPTSPFRNGPRGLIPLVGRGEQQEGSARPPRADGVIASFAADQDGVVGRQQLLAAGVGAGALTGRIRSRLLVPLHAGVYAVGNPRPSARGRLRAALLAVGDEAVLSHRSAAGAHDLLADTGPVHLSSVRHAHSRTGIVVHRPRRLSSSEVAVVDGFRCTSVARTLVDLAAIATPRQLERALDQAELMRTYDGTAIRRALRSGRPGAGRLRRALEAHVPGTTITRSRLEERFLALCRRARLAQPTLNVPMVLGDGTAIVVDALWPGVAVELDGRDVHARVRAFESDRRRDNELLASGLLPARFTWRMLTRDPAWVVARVRGHLDMATVLRAGQAS